MCIIWLLINPFLKVRWSPASQSETRIFSDQGIKELWLFPLKRERYKRSVRLICWLIDWLKKVPMDCCNKILWTDLKAEKLTENKSYHGGLTRWSWTIICNIITLIKGVRLICSNPESHRMAEWWFRSRQGFLVNWTHVPMADVTVGSGFILWM